jgi:hypothetical protein
MEENKWFGRRKKKKAVLKISEIVKENSMIPESSSLSRYNNEEVEFHRWDLIVRYLAIENHLGENDYGWRLYRNLRIHQSAEFGDGTVQSDYDQTARRGFEELIDSVKLKGYKRKYPIPVNSDTLRLNGGAQRLMCCIYFGIDEIPVIVDHFDPDANYPLDWFTLHGFEADDIQLIKDGQIRMFEKMSNYEWE